MVETEEHEGRSEEHEQQFHPVVGSQPRPSKQPGACFEMFLAGHHRREIDVAIMPSTERGSWSPKARQNNLRRFVAFASDIERFAICWPAGRNWPAQPDLDQAADSVLTMTDGKSAPARSLNTGEKILHKMRDGDDAPAIAKRLTREVCRVLRGETAPTVTEFNRAIGYPPSGMC